MFTTSNHLISLIGSDILVDRLEVVDLVAGQVLVKPGEAVEHFYFVEKGVVSAFMPFHPERSVELAMIGCEGVTHAEHLLGDVKNGNGLSVVLPGTARRIPVDELRKLFDGEHAVQDALKRFIRAYVEQVTSSTISHACADVPQRLARFLLMLQDRFPTGTFALSHAKIGARLTARRPGVTDALHYLEGAHAIKSVRGEVVILSRMALIEAAGQFYGKAETAYRDLLGEAFVPYDDDDRPSSFDPFPSRVRHDKSGSVEA